MQLPFLYKLAAVPAVKPQGSTPVKPPAPPAKAPSTPQAPKAAPAKKPTTPAPPTRRVGQSDYSWGARQRRYQYSRANQARVAAEDRQRKADQSAIQSRGGAIQVKINDQWHTIPVPAGVDHRSAYAYAQQELARLGWTTKPGTKIGSMVYVKNHGPESRTTTQDRNQARAAARQARNQKGGQVGSAQRNKTYRDAYNAFMATRTLAPSDLPKQTATPKNMTQVSDRLNQLLPADPYRMRVASQAYAQQAANYRARMQQGVDSLGVSYTPHTTKPGEASNTQGFYYNRDGQRIAERTLEGVQPTVGSPADGLGDSLAYDALSNRINDIDSIPKTTKVREYNVSGAYERALQQAQYFRNQRQQASQEWQKQMRRLYQKKLESGVPSTNLPSVNDYYNWNANKVQPWAYGNY